MSDPEVLLLVEEVAERLRCDRSTVRRHVRNGNLRATRPGGGRILIYEDSVTEFLKRGEVEPDPPPPPRIVEVYVSRPRAPSHSAQSGLSFRERAKQAREQGG